MLFSYIKTPGMQWEVKPKSAFHGDLNISEMNPQKATINSPYSRENESQVDVCLHWCIASWWLKVIVYPPFIYYISYGDEALALSLSATGHIVSEQSESRLTHRPPAELNQFHLTQFDLKSVHFFLLCVMQLSVKSSVCAVSVFICTHLTVFTCSQCSHVLHSVTVS